MRYVKPALRWLLGVGLAAQGVNHFVNDELFVRIMPPYLPWHRELVWLSGAFEVVLGVLLLVPRVSAWAAWGIIALFVAVFPANVQMALHTDLYPNFPPVVLWLRLPFQAVLIAWAYWFTRPAGR
jgi:uncharacterized membrane protein